MKCIAIFILCFADILHAQPTVSAYSRQSNISCLNFNQALLAKFNRPSVAVYSERKFLLKELSLYHLAANLTTHAGNFGLSAGYFGFTDYNETYAGLSYARKLGDRIDAGVRFRYRQSSVGYDAGVIIHLTDQFNAGFQVTDLSLYRFGIGYDVSENFSAGIEIEKEEDQPVNISAGFQYNFLQQIFIQAGISTAASLLYTAFGYSWRSVRIDCSFSFHVVLGITPGLLIVLPL